MHRYVLVFIDFTQLAAREGWFRIPGLTAPDGDWRKYYNDIAYWHYERRDGLLWYDAMQLVHPPERLQEWITRAKLRERDYTDEMMDRLGLPE